MKGRILFEDVTKIYQWRGRRRRYETLKGALFQRRRGHRKSSSPEEHLALDRISLDVAPGEAVALIGPNGSGKSTVLKLAGGILQPTSGAVQVGGRVTALIELGAGFHPEITGSENVLINGMLLGLSRREIEERMPAIVKFAGIGSFIDQPVKTYSSGMYVRLGFAVAVAVDPDVLLIDEVLAVGDEAFNRRCLDHLARMRQQGVSMVLVSHDLDLVSSFSDRVLYLDQGRVVADGPPDSVVARYRSDVAGVSDHRIEESVRVRVLEEGRRWGTGDVEILGVELVSGKVPMKIFPSGSAGQIRIRYKVQQPVEDFVFGIAWHRVDGTQVGGHNTDLDGLVPRRLVLDGEVCCTYDSLQLAPGKYSIDVAVHAQDGLAYDYWRDAIRVRVTSSVDWPGVWAPPHRWETDGPEWEG